MIEYPFRKVASKNFGALLKPIIPVTLIGPDNYLDIFALLDSGADISIIPYSAGEILGLNPDLGTRFELQGMGEGSISYLLCPIRLNMDGFEITIRIGWALVEEVPFILGRLDLFEKMGIEFKAFENKILLKKCNEK